ncbi:MAG TPA: hypothetical protein VEC37_19160 [Bacillota bacterium]|nr:hypothetical protein [Bacillota bacterium]
MRQSHTCQFKINTVLPNLAQCQIRQIDIALNEIQLIDREQSLVARGIVQRRIRYLGPDGRQRGMNDEFDFEVVLGECRAEVVSLFQTELKQEYYLFQNTPVPGGQPVLEHAFQLTVWWPEAPPPVPVEPTEELQLEKILKRGSFCRIVKLPVTLPEEGARPKQGVAELILDPRQQFPLVTGMLKGRIGYLGQSYHELEFEQAASFLVRELPDQTEGTVTLNGTVSDISWWPGDLNNNIWTLVLKLDFQWYFTQKQELACLTECRNNDWTPVRILTNRVVHQQALQFTIAYNLAALQGQPGEVKATLKRNKEVFTKNGLLLTADLIIEAFYEHSEGMEAYQQWKVEFNELVPEPIRPENRDLSILATVEVALQKFGMIAGQLNVELGLDYQLIFLENRLAQVIAVSDSPWAILANVQLDRQTFTVMGEAEFLLRSWPWQVNQVRTEVVNLIVTPKAGWLNVQGQLEVTVIYCDRDYRQRMDVYHHHFQESLLWEGLSPPVEVNTHTKLDFDTYEAQGQHLFYKYMLELKMETSQKRELQIAVWQPANPVTPVASSQPQQGRESPEVLSFLMEEEIELQQGTPKEIETNRIAIDWFKCREVGKAFLVEGALNSELEYWDRGGFLRREWFKVPFWKFVQTELEEAVVNQRLIPQIRQYGCQPVGTWPWQKGTVRIRVEIELSPSGGEDLSSEDTTPEPD